MPARLAANAWPPTEIHETSLLFLPPDRHRRSVSPSAQQSQQPTFRSGAKTVAVYATVAEKDGRLITEPDARRLRDPRQRQAAADDRLLNRRPAGERRDDARSQRQHARQRAARRAGSRSVRPQPRSGDAARIGTFADRIVIQPEGFTSDQNALLRILRSDLPVTGPTPLWNAIDRGHRRRSRNARAERWCSSSATAATRRRTSP